MQQFYAILLVCNFHFFDIALRCKFESSRYGVSSKIQKSSKFKFNSNPYLQPRSPRLGEEEAHREGAARRERQAQREDAEVVAPSRGVPSSVDGLGSREEAQSRGGGRGRGGSACQEEEEEGRGERPQAERSC